MAAMFQLRSSDILSNATIGLRYQLLDKLGAGSMGVVYRALDRLTGKFVALKRVKIGLGQSPFLDHELRLALAHEFQSLASLRHPYIISVLDYGFDTDNVPYLVMELLENAATIRQAGQKQALKTQVTFLIQLLQALAYLHQRGIVHRDLKPKNVLVADNQVKVVDFGLAALRGQSSGSAGTINYMAPEVLVGKPADISTDLYGIGLIAFELFAGYYPFNRTGDAEGTVLSPEQLVNHILRTPPEVITENLSAPIAAILNRLLAKNPADRYSSAGQVIDAFNSVLDDPLPYETAITRESFLQAAQFVGRANELGVLSDALSQAVAGQGSVWLVGGESGVGKSRLVEELRVRALVQGVLVLRGQAISEGSQPYQVWREILRWLCLQTPLNDLEASVLKSLVPDIASLLERPVPYAPTLDPQAAQERLISVIESVLGRQQRPILLMLEDLQWAGSEGLTLLARFSRNISKLAILIVGNYRDDERSNVPAIVPRTQTLKLNRLTELDIAKLTGSMLGAAGQAPNVVGFLQRESEGNVFFLIEMVRALAEEAGSIDNIVGLTLPKTIFTGGLQQFVRRRLLRVPEEAHPLLRLAALAGRDLDPTVLSALDPGVNLPRWLNNCADAAVLEAVGDRWRFAHDKLRESLIAELPRDTRADLHRQVAQALEVAYPGAPEYTISLRYHWSQAGDNAKTIHYATLAGEQSLSSAAYKEAIQYFEQALALYPRDSVPLEAAATEYQLGMAYYGLANIESSRAHMLRALDLLGWSAPAAPVRLYLALAKELTLQLVRPVRWLERYSTHPREVLLLASRICAHLTQVGFFSGSFLSSALHTVRAVNFAEAAGISPELSHSYAHFALAIGLIPFDRLAQRYSRLALTVASTVENPSAIAYSHYITAFYQTTVANWEQAGSSFQQALTLLDQIGDKRRWREALANYGYMLGLQGKFAESYRLRAELDAAAQRDDDIQARGWGTAGMGEMSVWMHNSEEAVHYLQVRIDLIDQFVDVLDPTTPCFALLALAFWRAGQPERARQAAGQALKHMALLKNIVFHTFHGFASLAEVYLRMWEARPDDSELAQAANQATMALQSYSRRFIVYQSWALRNLGMYLWLLGKRDRAQRAWQKSLNLATRLGLPFDKALVCYELGRHAEIGTPQRQTYLQRAIEIFQAIGANYDLQQAQAALTGMQSARGATVDGR